jgi:hypothetical protein
MKLLILILFPLIINAQFTVDSTNWSFESNYFYLTNESNNTFQSGKEKVFFHFNEKKDSVLRVTYNNKDIFFLPIKNKPVLTKKVEDSLTIYILKLVELGQTKETIFQIIMGKIESITIKKDNLTIEYL